METQITQLMDTTNAFEDWQTATNQKKEQLLKEARESAQQEVRRLNEAFEKELTALEAANQLEIAAYEKNSKEKTNVAIQNIQKIYQLRKEDALKKFIEEVF